ncbi:MAG: hypothetical protein K1X57_03045 [Gemmataceae bacterium]|nr:hypothetical protein [Gemmataceae bacterium]
MSFVRQLITLPRRRPRLAVVLSLVLFWLGWYVRPPRPDFRYEGPPGYSVKVLASGRQANFHERSSGSPARTYRAQVVDISTGRVTSVSYLADWPTPDVSPNGDRAITGSFSTRRVLRSWPTAKHICVLPEGYWEIQWSPDGRYLAMSGEQKLIIIRSSTGETVSQLSRGEVAPVFLPDSTGICVLSADRSRIEVWGFEPFRLLTSYALPYRPDDPKAMADDKPIADSCRITEMYVSENGCTLVASFVRFPSTANGLRAIDSVVLWSFESGKQTTFDIGEHYPERTVELQLSADCRTIGASIKRTLINDPKLPAWQTSAALGEWSRASAWKVNDGGALEIKTPSESKLVVPCGDYIICVDYDQFWILDEQSGKTVSRLPGAAVGRYWSPQTSTGYVAFNRSEQPSWLQGWLQSNSFWTFPKRPSGIYIARMQDGSISRFIPNRSHGLFDSGCNLWTNGCAAAGGDVVERWSPEVPHSWWLYAVTAAGVGYLIWPALVRLTSRWRRTRPAGVTA